VAFAFENHLECKFGILRSSYSGVQEERMIQPEAPELGSEKPPLI
jgi:hypothetical protein